MERHSLGGLKYIQIIIIVMIIITTITVTTTIRTAKSQPQ